MESTEMPTTSAFREVYTFMLSRIEQSSVVQTPVNACGKNRMTKFLPLKSERETLFFSLLNKLNAGAD
jgi:hypothetical protein